MALPLDIAGTVHAVPGGPAKQGTHHPVDLDWCDLTPETQAAVTALFADWSLAPSTWRADLTAASPEWEWSLTRDTEHDWWDGSDYPDPETRPAFRSPRFTDLAPETLARIIAGTGSPDVYLDETDGKLRFE